MISKASIHSGDWMSLSHGDRFDMRGRSLTGFNNPSGLGCSVYKVPPGKQAFPKHTHLANDEAIFVIAGRGTLTVGEESSAVGEGDFVLMPRGADNAHQLVNDGDTDLTYLCMSTMNHPDVVHYPNSDKLGVLPAPWSPKGPGKLGGFYKAHAADYFDGED